MERGDWIGPIEAYLGLPDEDREALGRSARAAVIKHYSYASWSDVWRWTMDLS